MSINDIDIDTLNDLDLLAVSLLCYDQSHDICAGILCNCECDCHLPRLTSTELLRIT